MRAVFTKAISNIKITKEEKEVLLKADEILQNIFKTLDNNDYLGDDMCELCTALDRIDLECIVNNFLEVE